MARGSLRLTKPLQTPNTDEKGSCVIPRVYLSCGEDEPMRRFSLDYSTAIKVASDYTFNTATTLKKFQLLDPCQMTPGLIDFLEQLKKANIPIALGTNAPWSNVEFTLKKGGILDYFQQIVYADLVSKPKPDPEIYLKAAELLGVS